MINEMQMKASLAMLLDASLQEINKIDALIRVNGLQNEQWFIDWQDKLNEISVR